MRRIVLRLFTLVCARLLGEGSSGSSRFRPSLSGFVCFVAFFSLTGCESTPVPKPKAYPRVHFPDRTALQHFGSPECPFQFDLPAYYTIEKKGEYFGETVEHPCWGYNLNVPALNGTIYLTYKELSPDQRLDRLTEEAYRLTFSHARKADYIEPVEIATENGAYGLLYSVGGDAASPLQFFVTDTARHFLRGTLNFRTRPNADSLAPVIQFVSEDIVKMLEGLEWE